MADLPMLEGRATGGPRAGVKLSATIRWDGRIAKSGGGKATGFYAGRYRWSPISKSWYWTK